MPSANPPRLDTETTPMLTPYEIVAHVFCPRFTYFGNVLMIPQHEEQRHKVMVGRAVHEQRTTQNRDYLRSKIGVAAKEIAVYLASPRLRIRGVVDEVLTLKDGTMAPLDYKYTPYREQAFKTHQIQVTMYGLLIREIYGKPVARGYVAYVRGGSRLIEVQIDEPLERRTMRLIDEVFDIITTGRLPKRTPDRAKCGDCCYKNICV
jgi:CRISPR-associated exonuclease Cas4